MSVNIHEDMNNAINILLDSNKHIGDYEYAFDLIEEYIETIDYANGILFKIVVCASFFFYRGSN